ncbi:MULTISPECIES: CC0125/CC1285 family lipoprotein [Photobacterium]|uniref:Lipoprotein n=1 Tax=Photobacterium ganghwense TaxID=320778 RepID=A0A0J1K2C8_9GAMM|nr:MULTISPECIES: hypothetical protein [Photobacterium]KLV08577.1 hypothetical protein ABT57_12110 [Photobacterium ganghwense]MBV1839096.1 hypothetical protein [Photobacterium ganghwense]PSU10691.1 hypothetical protein C9I92_00730 [Photobacterium ganghwense]QSV12835.1 hypothetical protein FH974_08565 [Photobacterium ganghwense]
MNKASMTLCGLTALILAGCATPYDTDKSSFWSFGKGFEVSNLSSDTWQISFVGNEYTDRTKARNYLLHKAAELAQNAGYPYFMLRGEQNYRDQTGTSGFGTSSHDFLYGVGNITSETTVMVEAIGLKEKPQNSTLPVYESGFILQNIQVKS